jgi:hypothetical protein
MEITLNLMSPEIKRRQRGENAELKARLEALERMIGAYAASPKAE